MRTLICLLILILAASCIFLASDLSGVSSAGPTFWILLSLSIMGPAVCLILIAILTCKPIFGKTAGAVLPLAVVLGIVLISYDPQYYILPLLSDGAGLSTLFAAIQNIIEIVALGSAGIMLALAGLKFLLEFALKLPPAAQPEALLNLLLLFVCSSLFGLLVTTLQAVS